MRTRSGRERIVRTAETARRRFRPQRYGSLISAEYAAPQTAPRCCPQVEHSFSAARAFNGLRALTEAENQMREHAQNSGDGIERLFLFPLVRQALGFKTNGALLAACQRHGVPIVTLSSKSKALRQGDYALLLARATGTAVKEVA